MSKRQTYLFHKALLKFGIIPFISFSNFYTHAENLKESNLVILESRGNKVIPEKANLQHKISSLTSLAAEQTAKIQTLNTEIKNLKNKLHLSQISKSNNTDKQLYTSFKQESAQKKELQNQLEKAIKELKNENENRTAHNLELDNHIEELLNEISLKSDHIKTIEDRLKQEKEKNLTVLNDTVHLKNLAAELEQESLQYKQAALRLENSIVTMQEENNIEKDKTLGFIITIEQLKNALDDQKSTIESLQDYNAQHFATLNESNEQKLIYEKQLVALNDELDQNKSINAQLDQFVKELKSENEHNKNVLIESTQKIDHLIELLAEQEGLLNNFKASSLKNSDQLSQNEQELNHFKAINDSLNQEILVIKNESQDLESILVQIKEEKESERNKLIETEKELISLQERFKSLDNEIQIATDTKENYFKNLEEKELALRDSQEKLSLYEQEIDYLKNSMSNIENDLNFQKNLLVLKNHEIELSLEKAQDNHQKALTLNLFEALENEQSLYLLSHLSLSKDNRDKLDQLQNELAESSNRQNTLHEMIEHLKNENEEEKLKNNESTSKILSLSNAVDATTIEMQQRLVEQQMENIVHLENAKNELSLHLETISSHENEILNHKLQLNEVQEQLQKQKDLKNKISQEKIALLKDLYELFEVELMKNSLTAREKLNHHDMHLDQSKQVILSLEENLEQMHDTIEALQKENLKIASLQSELDDLQQMHDQSEKNYTEIYKEHHLVLSDLESLKNDHEKLQDIYNEGVKIQEEFKQIITNQLDKTAQTVVELESTKSSHEEIQSQLMHTQDKLSSAKEQLNQKDLEYQEKINALQKLLDEETDKKSQLKNEFESNLSLLEERQKKIEELQNRLDYPSNNWNEISESEKYQSIKDRLNFKDLLEINNLETDKSQDIPE